jgi:hypothetical protein
MKGVSSIREKPDCPGRRNAVGAGRSTPYVTPASSRCHEKGHRDYNRGPKAVPLSPMRVRLWNFLTVHINAPVGSVRWAHVLIRTPLRRNSLIALLTARLLRDSTVTTFVNQSCRGTFGSGWRL